MARIAHGTKQAAKDAERYGRGYIPVHGAAALLKGGAGKVARDVAGHFTTGPFKELLQGQGRVNLSGGAPKKKAKKKKGK